MWLFNNKASLLRFTRRLHRFVAIAVFAFFLLTTITGIVLGFEGTAIIKDIAVSSPAEWKSLDTLQKQALTYFQSSEYRNESAELQRIDMRLNKGTIDFVFKGAEVMVAGKTGELLRIR